MLDMHMHRVYIEGMEEDTYYYIAYDNPYTHERVVIVTPGYHVGRILDALEDQGVPCGMWSSKHWYQVSEKVLAGNYKFKEN